MNFQFSGDVKGFEAGIALLCEEMGVTLGEGGYTVNAKRMDVPTLCVKCEGKNAEILYAEQCQFNRAFGLLVQQLREGKSEIAIEEKPSFTMNGPMFDMSQGNAAFNVKTMKKNLVQLALMGLNMAMLYCEDNFEVQNHPYFGYMRPTYTEADMKELDDYAFSLGIEMIPCVQALAHMPDALHWDVFQDIRDYEACLLVGKKETYDFLRDLLISASRPFRTKRIHIGMDEAWNLGRGQYIDVYGYRPAAEIMKEHLARVMELVRELGLEPMMWDDMFFRALNDGKYYTLANDTLEGKDGRAAKDEEFFKKASSMVPEGMRCVYWDYYHLKQEEYEELIRQHKYLGDGLIFAGGLWSWRGFAMSWDKSLRTTTAALAACKKLGVKEVFMTTWGDNGTEALATVTLIGCQLFAELAYRDGYDRDEFARRFAFCTGGCLEDFEQLQYLDQNDLTVAAKPKDPSTRNCSKHLMWQDILTGLMDKNYDGFDFESHYKALTPKLELAATRNGRFNGIFRFSALVSRVLERKAQMGLRVTAAYRAGDKEALRRYAEVELPALAEDVRATRLEHMENWFEIYKPFGWDVMDMRWGALLARIDSAIRQLKGYLEGKCERIEELEVERLDFNGKPGPSGVNRYGMFVSPSHIDPRA